MLADVLDSLGAMTFVTVNRAANGFDGHGRALPASTSAGSTTGMMQPARGVEVERLKEGLHAKELRTYFSKDSLVVADHDAGTIGTHITTPDNLQWEVLSKQDWNSFGPDFAGFYQYLIARVDL